jgi:hypothetical protein
MKIKSISNNIWKFAVKYMDFENISHLKHLTSSGHNEVSVEYKILVYPQI